MKFVHGMRNVYDHPLSFLNDADADEIRRTASRNKFTILDQVPKDSKLIGVFGFLGRYKGIDTVIRSLHHLPEEYHLLIFGGCILMKSSRTRRSTRSCRRCSTPVISTPILPSGCGPIRRIAPGVSVSVDGSMRDLLIGHPKDLSHRIHFLGATSDEDFLSGMALCDTVVFPYLEVGQSSSGPISQALELGCRVVASRTHTFLQLDRYHRNTIEFFDIGNHLELAARILARPQFNARARFLSFNVETNKAVYLAANGVPSKIRAAVERDAR
jgi:glycosyltransferase involved in cell wall biosynthesis